MSDKCGNCDCADRSQCVKTGNQMAQAEMSYAEPMVMEVAENDGCKCCGPSCACTTCTCCTH